MRISKIIYINTVVAIAVFVGIYSCSKKNVSTEDTGYTTDQATAEKTINDIGTISDMAANITQGIKFFRTTATTIGGCATVTKDSSVSGGVVTHTLTIDFGTVDCLCFDSRTRSGKIIVTFQGHYEDSGSVRNITFDNFYQNNNKIVGTKTVTNMGHNTNGKPYFNISVNCSIALAKGGTISTTWSRVRTWLEGYNDQKNRDNDVYSVSGNGIMIRANGEKVTQSISAATPLIMAHNCKWIEAGIIVFTLPNGNTRILNYGNTPNCDDQAEVTLANGKTKSITLP